MDNKRLRRLREEKGLTQDELARRINTSRSNIANYENNKNLPSIEVLKELANFFGCTVDYLVGNSDCRGGQEMGLFTDLDKIEARLKEIRTLANETANRITDMNMTFDDYRYFKERLDNEISKRPIGK